MNRYINIKYYFILLGFLIHGHLLFGVPQQTHFCGWEKLEDPETNREETDSGQLLVIPVVVHIVFGSVEQDISDSRINSQLQVLNEDFRRKNPDATQTNTAFTKVAADCRIEFRLAAKDPSGNPTGGITRTYSTHGPFGDNDIFSTSKGGKDPWDPEKYFNIYVCELPPLLKGYSSSPGGLPATDGVVIDYRYFGVSGTAGAPFNKGRTCTHETGHYLGLSHPWGKGGCNSDDGIADTPPQDREFSGCLNTYYSCGSNAMTQNFMQYSDDDCMNFFTAGQKERMRKVLLNVRSSILENTAFTLSDRRQETFRFIIYPNPVVGNAIRIQEIGKISGLDLIQAEIFDQTGKMVLRNSFREFANIDISSLKPGIYLILIKSGNKIFRDKIVLTSIEN